MYLVLAGSVILLKGTSNFKVKQTMTLMLIEAVSNPYLEPAYAMYCYVFIDGVLLCFY